MFPPKICLFQLVLFIYIFLLVKFFIVDDQVDPFACSDSFLNA